MGYIKKMVMVNKPMGIENEDIVRTMLRFLVGWDMGSPMGKNAYTGERRFEKNVRY